MVMVSASSTTVLVLATPTGLVSVGAASTKKSSMFRGEGVKDSLRPG